MRERACSLILMMQPIEFFEIPDQYEIEFEFRDGGTQTYACRCDVSHNCQVTEIYDTDGYVIATDLRDLFAGGVVKATVKAHHKIDITELVYPPELTNFSEVL